MSVGIPAAPAAEALETLPTEQRDFSALSARIVLQSPSEADGSAPHERLPASIEAGVHYPVIDGH
jgi:hypothetical protein